MKNIFLFLCLFVAFYVFAADSDFSFRKGLPGWIKNNRAVYFDFSEKISAGGSLKLVNAASVSKVIKLEPGAEYEVSVYIKAQNVKGGKYKGALLRLTDGKNFFAVTADPKYLPQQGSFDWTKCTRRLKSSFFKSNKVTVMPILTCQGTVWFDDLKIVKIQSNSGNSFFRKSYGNIVKKAAIIPGGTFGFFTPDETIGCRFLIDSTVRDLTYTLSVKDESGKKVYSSSAKKYEENFTLPKQKAGYYIIEAELFSSGKKVYELQSAFAVNVPLKKLDPFFQYSYGATSDIIKGIKRVGGGSIVLKSHNFQQPDLMRLSAEDFAARFVNFNKPFLDDPDLQLAIAVGCSLHSSFRNKEELKAGWPLMSDPVLKQLLDCVKNIHSKTKGRIREWIIGCEIPTNAIGGSSKTLCSTWTEAMFNMMVRARMISRALKAVDPGMKIIVGGNNRQEYTETVERIVMGDLVNDFDEYAIDAYTGNWDMRLGRHSIPELNLMNFYNAASNLSASLGKGKFIRNDETGYAINYGARFDKGLAVEQAYLTARTMIITRYAPVSRFELHMPTYHHIRLIDPKDDAVCMTTIWKPVYWGKRWYDILQPGGAMYATAAGELSFAKSLAEIKSGNIYSYLFKKPDGSVLITLWNIAREQKFVCDFPSGTRGINMYGRSIPVKNLVIGKAPVYLNVKMSPAQAVALVTKAVLNNSPEFKCSATSDTVYIQSFAALTRECKLKLPGQAEKTVKVFPGKTTVVSAKVAGNGKLIAPDGREYAVELSKVDFYTVPKIKSRPVFDGSGKWLTNLKSGLLKYPDHIHPAEALQPERRYFKTSFNPNGHNISARYWTAYDDNNFYLAVKVDDPVHLQRQAALELWKDDSIQFVLSHEGIKESATGGKPVFEYNFGLALTAHGTQLVKYLGKECGLKTYPARVTRKGNETFYEAAIPWSAIGGKATRFGFVIFNNNWKTMKSAPYHLDFSEGITNGFDDTKLKVLKYAD
ncbi:MAG: hypothetical protein E7044_00380 [Lentisphaerae bacterium]|nr:hypothetical protein [Lentisphaerota bacterium]